MLLNVELGDLIAMIFDRIKKFHRAIQHNVNIQLMDLFFYICLSHLENSISNQPKNTSFIFTFFKKTFLIFFTFMLDSNASARGRRPLDVNKKKPPAEVFLKVDAREGVEPSNQLLQSRALPFGHLAIKCFMKSH